MKPLYKKEVMQYINSPAGYVIPLLFSLFANYFFMKDVFVVGSASMRPFFGIAPWLLMIFIPALAIRSFSEEKRTNTIEVLMTLPLTEQQIVLAKISSIFTICAGSLLLTLSVPLILLGVSKLFIPEVIVGYTGLLLLSLSYISFCVYVSIRISNTIASFLFSTVFLFIATTLSSDFLSNVLPKIAQDALLFISPLLHSQYFFKGVIDLRSLFYFVGISFLFFRLTVMELQKRG